MTPPNKREQGKPRGKKNKKKQEQGKPRGKKWVRDKSNSNSDIFNERNLIV
jgi:hypothetical protein